MMPEKDHFDDDNYQPGKKHKDRDAVDTMHVLHPLRIWLVWISFFNI